MDPELLDYDANDNLTEYVIDVHQVWIKPVVIQALSLDDALEGVRNGEGDWDRYPATLSDTVSVEPGSGY